MSLLQGFGEEACHQSVVRSLPADVQRHLVSREQVPEPKHPRSSHPGPGRQTVVVTSVESSYYYVRRSTGGALLLLLPSARTICWGCVNCGEYKCVCVCKGKIDSKYLMDWGAVMLAQVVRDVGSIPTPWAWFTFEANAI